MVSKHLVSILDGTGVLLLPIVLLIDWILAYPGEDTGHF